MLEEKPLGSLILNAVFAQYIYVYWKHTTHVVVQELKG